MDLNLLVALDVLLEEGSVGGAAERLRLSQPAMSRTLSRIRRALGDEILVRSGRLMLPTSYAESIRAEVHELVRRSSTVLSGVAALDLQRLKRTFTLRCHDALTDLLAPPLITEVRRAAPGVRLRFLAELADGTGGLRSAETDLEIGSDASSGPDTRAHQLGSSQLVLVARGDTELPAALMAEDYAALTHITISRRGRLSDPVDELLAVEGLTRRVLATVPSTRVALDLVATGGTVTTLPELVYGALGQRTGLISRTLPFVTRPVEVGMRWHVRHDTDPAHRWLRDRVRGILATADTRYSIASGNTR